MLPKTIRSRFHFEFFPSNFASHRVRENLMTWMNMMIIFDPDGLRLILRPVLRAPTNYQTKRQVGELVAVIHSYLWQHRDFR